jgi:hypothetical protein
MLKNIVYTITLAGALFTPLFPTAIQGANWKATYEIASYLTDDGLLSPTQYFEDKDGTFMIRGDDGTPEAGFPIRVKELPKDRTERVEESGQTMYINFYEKLEDSTEFVVLTEDKADYDRLRQEKNIIDSKLEPDIKELQSAYDLLVAPIEVQAVFTPDDYTQNNFSVAAQTVTFSHVVTTADTIVVAIGVRDASSDVPIQVTYNSLDLTQQTSFATTTYNASLWYRVSPSTGTNNVFIDYGVSTASADASSAIVYSLSGVDQTTVFNTTQSAQGVGTSTNTVTGHVAGGIGIDMIVLADPSITGNVNTYEGSKIGSYYDSGSYTFYSHEYNLKYVNKIKSVSAEETSPNGVFFKDDGTKMYILGSTGDDINQYSCSTAWDVTSCTADSVTLSVLTQDNLAHDLFFKPDGTHVYVVGTTNDKIFDYSCSTAWTLSSCSYSGNSTSTPIGEGVSRGLFFKPDGTRVYTAGTTLDSVVEYALNVAWDLTTASSTGKTFTVGSNPTSVTFSSDGKFMIVIRPAVDTPMYYLSTAWDVSTAVLARVFVPRFTSGASGEFTSATMEGLYLKDLNTGYFVGTTNDTVYTYEQSTATTTTVTGLDNPSGNEIWISLVGILNPQQSVSSQGGGIINYMISEQ